MLAIAPYYASDYAAMGISEEAKRAYYASLLRGVPELEVVTIAPARHFVMLDQPHAFSRRAAQVPRRALARYSTSAAWSASRERSPRCSVTWPECDQPLKRSTT